MTRRSYSLSLLALLLVPAAASADGFTPAEAAKRMKLPDGFSARVVAAEPMIRQPVSISFDARGRMWVLQYLQYPNYAGLKAVKQDQYLRTIWDKVPDPPPHGPKGADRLTICSDPDENGVYRKSRDFVTGLNIASGFCLGHGGVYVAQPPYLLFYPDKNEDDVPDGDPEVLLTGFGMDDTHSLANSLQWGPDGWLYGAAGSTSTCKIKNPADPKMSAVEFQQGVWRFQPETKKFELFSEGGGNTYGLDFDKHGQLIAGTNYGGFACLHQMQGAYYVKGFSKHGPLHNPHTYGYFDHVPYTGFKGGHVTCGGIVYQADAYPPQYRDQYIAANVLSNAVYWHKLEADKSSFKASHGGELLEGNDPWFRPIDCLQGPDGSVYVVDFYDRRAAHLDPIDSWDRTNGRVYKIEYKGTAKVQAFDLRKKTSAELVELLKHPNKWWRNEARRLLAERQDKSVHATLREWVKGETGLPALEALWALYVSGGWDENLSAFLLAHLNEHVRAWAVRLIGEQGVVTPETRELISRVAGMDASPIVLAQLACTARRLPTRAGDSVLTGLVYNPTSEWDSKLTPLIWWGFETLMTRERTLSYYPAEPSGHYNSLVARDMAERFARRVVSSDFPERDDHLWSLLKDAAKADPTPVLRGMAKGLETTPLSVVPGLLVKPFRDIRQSDPKNMLLVEVMARMNDADALATLREHVVDSSLPETDRLKAVGILQQLRDPKARGVLIRQLNEVQSDAFRVGLLSALESYDLAIIGVVVLGHYPKWSPAVKGRAVQLLLSRPAWALALLKQYDAGTFPKADLTLDHAKTAVKLDDKAVAALVEKHFGKLAPATAGEKQARITWLNVALGRVGPGDPAKGHALFTKHCAACHQFHGEGGKVGPDLTTADRKNRGYLLAQIVDPSGYIRPEYVVQNVVTADGRKLSGLATEGGGTSVTLVTVVNDQPQRTVVAKADIETMTPSAVSLMPEKLLDTLTEAEIGHLFAYLAADAPVKKPTDAAPTIPAIKKLTVCLVSGSFEYKSDDSLAAFQKHLEANLPVVCTRAFAESEKEPGIDWLENLDSADLAIFFTRRLDIGGAELERVKKYVASGKPVIGIRTASHGFQNWLEMDAAVFGGDYRGHYGQGIVCAVTADAKGKDHPILKDVGEFKTTGGLYKNPNVAADVTVLLRGTIPGQNEPVAWVREKGGRRVFYTSLGHPDDFKDKNFVRLLSNAVEWATRPK